MTYQSLNYESLKQLLLYIVLKFALLYDISISKLWKFFKQLFFSIGLKFAFLWYINVKTMTVV